MQAKRLFYVVALGLGLTLLVFAAMSGQPTKAQATCDRYVLVSYGADTGDCSDEAHPCKTVQYAINQASDSDVVCVADDALAPGPTIYAETIAITRSVILEGAWEATCVGAPTCSFTAVACAPEKVILDAQGTGRVISITGNITPTIDCFTITGGDAAGLGGDPGTTVDNDAGGGICSIDAAPIIINNVITGNYGCDICPVSYGRGGGIYLLNAPATAVISDNLIANNVADESTWGQGGGIMLRDSDAQVLSNTIEYNRAGHSAGYGGGITVKDGTPTIADNDILHNVGGTAVMCHGGGIFVWSATPVTIEHNLIEYNQAINGPGDPTLISRGGGIYYAGTPNVSAVIRDNTIRHNIASPMSPAGYGGGMYLSGLITPSSVSGNTLEWNIAGHNDDGNGGGIYVDDSEVSITGNHLFDNSATWAGNQGQGGGVYVNGGAVLIQSNVITGNFGAGFPGFPSTADGYGGGVAISGSLSIVQDNWIVGNGGTNGISGAGGAGGGLYGYLGTLQITGNTIADNTATQGNLGLGGGLYLEQVSSWLDANTILDNEAVAGLYGRGGGVRINSCPAFTLTNNIVARNEASERGSGIAIAANSTGELAHNTIAENLDGDGIGLYVNSNSDVLLHNNIIISHTVGITNADTAGSSVSATYTLFEGNGMDYGAGVTSSNEVPGPAMLLPNYHIGGGSGAINTATTLSWVTNDVDGDARPFGAAPDVGADEASCLARVGGADYTAIQDAIDAATPGQTVTVVEGVCYENLSINKTVTLEGGWTPTFSSRHADPASVSTINGMGTGRVISITETSVSIAPTIDGFTITDGDATGLAGSGAYGHDIGGGIYGWYADHHGQRRRHRRYRLGWRYRLLRR
jgi:hypothetical protein